MNKPDSPLSLIMIIRTKSSINCADGGVYRAVKAEAGVSVLTSICSKASSLWRSTSTSSSLISDRNA
ncbi:hypothetical protein EYF80_001365 [Liparis tanakae]|uniref:Uncharacterized protein n=1 Tax=Liparis tanakae TaxID=230148 RepID=A0A4Z2JH58_9TELE|nr:hypothetical protein EYF80_001365 [Liparis tanakae]